MTPGSEPFRGLRHIGTACTLLIVLAVAGCGGQVQPEKDSAFDNGAARARRGAMQAFANHRYARAASGFRRALELAYRSDDSRAVVDARYNLAASLAELGKYDEALRMLDAAEAELRREGRPNSMDIVLLRAAVNYRASQPQRAAALARQVISAPDVDPVLAARAWFLIGLIAADESDRPGLVRAMEAAGPEGENAALRADRVELSGRLAGLDGRTESAIEHLGEAARTRSKAGDYRAASRALAAAGEIARQAGQSRDAARYYLRAGRSAAARGDEVTARQWLQQAHRLALQADDGGSAEEAAAVLAALEDG